MLVWQPCGIAYARPWTVARRRLRASRLRIVLAAPCQDPERGPCTPAPRGRGYGCLARLEEARRWVLLVLRVATFTELASL